MKPAGLNGGHGPQGKQGLPGHTSGGATYIRWGKSSCPGATGTKLVYSGITGGSWLFHGGCGSNYLCLPKDSEYHYTLTYHVGIQGYSPIHGANVPSAACGVSTRPTVVMIPAKASNAFIWTKEYYGYLMSECKNHSGNTFECVD